MRSAAAGLRLAVFSFVGLLAGIWVAIAPWVIGFPQPPRGSWSAADISSAVAGGIVIAASATSLVAAAASAVGELREVTSPAGAGRAGQRA